MSVFLTLSAVKNILIIVGKICKRNTIHYIGYGVAICSTFPQNKLVTYSHSSFTNRCTFIKTLIKIYIKFMWLLHVSVYDLQLSLANVILI